MAVQLRKRLKGLPFTHCYTSPLGRAMQTASILTEGTDVMPLADERIREVNLGITEGLIMEELPPDMLHTFYHEPQNFNPEGGEGYEAAFQRVSALMRELESEKGCVLLVAHALILRLIRLYLLNLPLSEMMNVHTPGCCFCEAHYSDGKWSLKAFADDRCQSADYDPEHFLYFGSPFPVETIPEGAVLTPYTELAAAYAHAPQYVHVDLSGAVTHDGTKEGLIYRVDLADRHLELLGPAPGLKSEGSFYI